MKTTILSALALAIGLSAALTAPVIAAPSHGFDTIKMMDDGMDKRRKPRVKGGSGCDDAHDLIEHPECR